MIRIGRNIVPGPGRTGLWLIISLLCLLLVLACETLTPTQPNLSIIDRGYQPPTPAARANLVQAQAILARLARQNPLLAQELGKLPELRDGVSNQELAALRRIQSLYQADPAAFDAAFRRMHQVGIPQVRQFCTPLQAAFWLAQKGRPASGLVQNYRLEALLDAAWGFDASVILSQDELVTIIEGIKDPRERQSYLDYMKTGIRKYLIRNLEVDYQLKPELFSPDGLRILGKAMGQQDQAWQDFGVVVTRLNAPELAHYYVKHRIAHETYWGQRGGAEGAFHSGVANGWDTASFIAACLNRGGYEAYPYWVAHNPATFVEPAGHAGIVILVYRNVDGRYYVIDDAGSYRQGITGPYKDLGEIPYSGGRRIWD